MLTTRQITKADVTQIFNKPWYATAIDIVANDLDLLSQNELLEKITIEYSKHYGLAVFDTLKPEKILAIMGACPQDENPDIWWTWFFAPHDFPDFHKEVSIFARKTLEEQAAIRKPKEIRAYSPAGDKPEGIRWFKRLGFHKVENFVIPMNNGCNIFMFQRFFNE